LRHDLAAPDSDLYEGGKCLGDPPLLRSHDPDDTRRLLASREDHLRVGEIAVRRTATVAAANYEGGFVSPVAVKVAVDDGIPARIDRDPRPCWPRR
jgi:hypothetical protein